MEKTRSWISFWNVTTLVFVIGKVFGFVEFSWWVVFSPLIIEAVVVLLIVTIALIINFKSKKKKENE